MSYLGNQPAANFASVTKDTFSGDGSTVAFTLSKAATTNGVAVFVENVRQEPTTAYAVSGTTLTFTAAPVSASGNNIYVLHHNTPASTATHPAAQDLTAVNGTLTGTLGVTGESTLTGDATLSRSNQNGTVRLNLENTGAGGSTDYSEIKFNSTAGSTVTSVVQHRNNSGMNIGTTTDHPVSILQNNTAALTVTTDGDIDIESNNIFFSTAGKGIFLGATSKVSANRLDDYEEGTWTPTMTNITLSTAQGQYIKVGQLVTAHFNVVLPTTSTTNTAVISSLPFNSAGVNQYGGGFFSYQNTSYDMLTLYNQGETYCTILNGANAVNNSNISGKQFLGTIVYYSA